MSEATIGSELVLNQKHTDEAAYREFEKLFVERAKRHGLAVVSDEGAIRRGYEILLQLQAAAGDGDLTLEQLKKVIAEQGIWPGLSEGDKSECAELIWNTVGAELYIELIGSKVPMLIDSLTELATRFAEKVRVLSNSWDPIKEIQGQRPKKKYYQRDRNGRERKW